MCLIEDNCELRVDLTWYCYAVVVGLLVGSMRRKTSPRDEHFASTQRKVDSIESLIVSPHPEEIIPLGLKRVFSVEVVRTVRDIATDVLSVILKVRIT